MRVAKAEFDRETLPYRSQRQTGEHREAWDQAKVRVREERRLRIHSADISWSFLTVFQFRVVVLCERTLSSMYSLALANPSGQCR